MAARVAAGAEAVVVDCHYSGGEPADAEVLVYSPAEAGRAFQRQRTDLRGLASFVPDVPGVWRVVADDGLGHRVVLEVDVSAVGLAEPARPAPGAVWPVALASALAAGAAAWLLAKRSGPGA